MSAFRSARASRRSGLWQQHDAGDEDEDAYNERVAESPLLSRSSSTPYKLYTSRASGDGGGGDFGDEAGDNGSFSSERRKSRLSYSHASHLPTAASVQSATPTRRKNASFGSPGMRASGSGQLRHQQAAEESIATSATTPRKSGNRKARTSARFVRRKTFEQRLKDLPSDLVDRGASLFYSLSEHLSDPALGYPLGVALHVLALLSHLISPSSELSLTLLAGLEPAPRRGTSGSLFGEHSRNKRKSANSEIRKAIQQDRIDAWSWLAGATSIAVVAVAFYNAYHLFAARRRYRLWMRSAEDKVSSENARLVPINLDEDQDHPTFQEKITSFVLARLQRMPFVRWFVPEAPGEYQDDSARAQIHELNVWEAPEVSLRVAVVFSPLHALLWHIAGSSLLPISGLAAWMTFFATLAALSAQALLLSTSFTQLVKDRALLAAEMLKEYDQKFVLPRAMPSVRDASTMTDAFVPARQARMSDAPRRSDVYATPSSARQRTQQPWSFAGSPSLS